MRFCDELQPMPDSSALAQSQRDAAAAAASAMLYLDARLRDWVMLTIFAVVVLMAVARHFLAQLLAARPISTRQALQTASTLERAKALSRNCNMLPRERWLRRRNFFCEEKTGLLLKKPATAGAMGMLSDPTQMFDGMIRQVTTVLPQIAMMMWVQYFFGGYVVARTPFSITTGFKAMLQQNVDLSSLDASYISSVSWYFQCVFGLQGLMSVLLTNGAPAMGPPRPGMPPAAAGAMMPPMMMPGMGGPDPTAPLKAMKTTLEMVTHEDRLGDCEAELLRQDASASAPAARAS